MHIAHQKQAPHQIDLDGRIIFDGVPVIEKDPYPLPAGFEWSPLDVTNEQPMKELYSTGRRGTTTSSSFCLFGVIVMNHR